MIASPNAKSAPRSNTLPDLLDEIAARDPARELIVGDADRLSGAETRARVRQLAKDLLRLGVERGDKVALLMPNRPECGNAIKNAIGIRFNELPIITPQRVRAALETGP